MNLIPSLFPSIGWMYLYLNSNAGIDWDTDIFQKQTIRNRYRVMSPNGLQTLSIPVKHFHSGTPNSKIELSYKEDWAKVHQKALESNYGKSPFYEFIAPDLQNIYSHQYNFLADLQKASIEFLLNYMNINPDELKKLKSMARLHYDEQIIDLELKTGILNKFKMPTYYQVFSQKMGFIPHLSCLDLLFNEGACALSYLLNTKS